MVQWANTIYSDPAAAATSWGHRHPMVLRRPLRQQTRFHHDAMARPSRSSSPRAARKAARTSASGASGERYGRSMIADFNRWSSLGRLEPRPRRKRRPTTSALLQHPHPSRIPPTDRLLFQSSYFYIGHFLPVRPARRAAHPLLLHARLDRGTAFINPRSHVAIVRDEPHRFAADPTRVATPAGCASSDVPPTRSPLSLRDRQGPRRAAHEACAWPHALTAAFGIPRPRRRMPPLRFPLRVPLRILLAALPAAAGTPGLPATAAVLFRRQQLHHGQFFPVVVYNAAMSPRDYGPQAAHAPIHEPYPIGGIPAIFRNSPTRPGSLTPCTWRSPAAAAPVSLRARAPHHRPARKWGAVVLQGIEHRGAARKPRRAPPGLLQIRHAAWQAIHAAQSRHAPLPLRNVAARRLSPTRPMPRTTATHHHHGRRCPRGLRGGIQRRRLSWASSWPAMRGSTQSPPALPRPIPTQPPHPVGSSISGATDHYHPAPCGAYLSALAIFHEITQLIPHGSAPRKKVAHDLGNSRHGSRGAPGRRQ